jgi:hypothetical protein
MLTIRVEDYERITIEEAKILFPSLLERDKSRPSNGLVVAQNYFSSYTSSYAEKFLGILDNRLYLVIFDNENNFIYEYLRWDEIKKRFVNLVER